MLLLQNFFLQVQVISLLHSLVFIPKELLLGGGFFLLLELAFGKEIVSARIKYVPATSTRAKIASVKRVICFTVGNLSFLTVSKLS